MKNKLRIWNIMLLLLLFTSFQTAVAQPPHPDDQSNGSTNGGDPIGAGAPVGNGQIILLLMAALYGGKKIYHYKSDEVKESE